MTKSASHQGKRGGAAALVAAVIIAATAIIQPWEGRSLPSYQDIVGVWTVCDGITGPEAGPGKVYSHSECDAMLEREVRKHYDGVAACIDAPITTEQMAAVVSWTYNVGVRAACHSTLMRKLNAGNPASVWCAELLRWNRAGGREVRGLTNRRRAEHRVCIGDAR